MNSTIAATALEDILQLFTLGGRRREKGLLPRLAPGLLHGSAIMKALRTFLVPALLTFSALAGCSKEPAGPAKPANGAVDMIVDKTGFVPAVIQAKVGEPVTLRITRKTDSTCAREIVIKSAGINQPLPLDQTVNVTVTPKEKGEMRFACAMDHIAGKLIVN